MCPSFSYFNPVGVKDGICVKGGMLVVPKIAVKSGIIVNTKDIIAGYIPSNIIVNKGPTEVLSAARSCVGEVLPFGMRAGNGSLLTGGVVLGRLSAMSFLGGGDVWLG